MLDAKRRQGFLRTLVDFHSSYNGIQKKHAVMNNNQRQLFNHHRGDGGGGGGRDVAGRIRMDTKFPLLLSSGSRQDYTRGADEGTLALRAPQDVDFFLRHFAGGGAGEDNEGGDNHSTDPIDGAVVGARSGNGRGARHRVAVASAAERALARARDRAIGVVVVAAPPHRRGSKRLRPPGGGWGTRSYVVGVAGGRSGSDDVAAAERDEVDGDQDDDEDEDGDLLPRMTGAISLIDWLSSSRDRTAKGGTEDGIAALSAPSIPSRIPLENKVKDDDTASAKPSSPSTGNGIRTTMGLGDGDDIRIDPNEDGDENDDLQDGYIAM